MITIAEALKEYLVECKVQNQSEETIKAKGYSINKFIKYVGDIDLDTLTKIKIKEYITEQQSKLKPSSINISLKYLRSMYKYFVKEEITDRNPFDAIMLLKEEKGVIRTYSEDTIVSVLSRLNGRDYFGLRNRLVITLLIETGIRASELANIKVEDISEDAIRIKQGKGNKTRYVPVTHSLSTLLKRFMDSRKDYLKDNELEYLFVNKFKGQLTRQGVYKLIQKDIFKGVEVSEGVPITVHNFRRFFAQAMLDNVDLYTVSRLLGHSEIKTTERYVRSTEDKKILERGMLSPLSKLNK